MILSASRRTDIPAFYGEWFLRRLREGWMLVPRPRIPHQYTKLLLSPQTVDAIVFWTKNPEPFLIGFREIERMGYPFYVQFTMNPYGAPVEPDLPPLRERMDAFCRLSGMLGPERVVWRYDPVIVQGAFTHTYHENAFEGLASQLKGRTKRCVFSFLDVYPGHSAQTAGLADRELKKEQMEDIAAIFAPIARRNGMILSTCAETIDLSVYGVEHASCIDRGMIERLLGCRVEAKKDAGQRPACGCMESIDVGSYDSCGNGCVYCYATASVEQAARNRERHNPSAPALLSEPQQGDKIFLKPMKSIKTGQTFLF